MAENSRNLGGLSANEQDSVFDAQSYVKLITKPKLSGSFREKSLSKSKRKMVRTCSMTDAEGPRQKQHSPSDITAMHLPKAKDILMMKRSSLPD